MKLIIVLIILQFNVCFAITPSFKIPSLTNFIFKKYEKEFIELSKVKYGPSSICMLPNLEYLISFHQFFNPDVNIIKINSEGKSSPYLDKLNSSLKLDSVMSIRYDDGIIWILDNGRRFESTPKLIAWDFKKNKLHKLIIFPKESLSSKSFLRNIVIDPKDNYIYVSDPADGIVSAIIIVNTMTGVCKRVLEGDVSTKRDPSVFLKMDDRKVTVRQADGKVVYPNTGVSPIAIDKKGKWLYFAPRNGLTLFKIKTDFLKRTNLINKDLRNKVHSVSPKPISDSMVISDGGEIYFTDISRGSIDYVSPKEEYFVLRSYIKDSSIVWPSGLNTGINKKLIFFNNKLNLTPFYNNGKSKYEGQFSIYQLSPIAKKRFGF